MRQSRKSSVLKELVALGLFIDGTSRPIAKDLVTLSPSAGGRYSLRLRDQFHKVVRPVGVTKPKRKARSSGFSKSREGYNGPGYQGTAVEMCKKGIECTICAEVRGR